MISSSPPIQSQVSACAFTWVGPSQRLNLLSMYVCACSGEEKRYYQYEQPVCNWSCMLW